MSNVPPTTNASYLTQGILTPNIFPQDLAITGNLSGSYVYGNAAFMSNVPPTTNASYLTQGVLASNIFPNDITLTGNIQATYVYGNGAFLQGVITQNILSNASQINQGTIAQSVLPANIGNAITRYTGNLATLDTVFATTANVGNVFGNLVGGSISGNGVAITSLNAGNLFGNCDLEFSFPPQSIPAECIYGNLVPTIQANSLDCATYLSGVIPQRLLPKTLGNAATVFIGQSSQISYLQSFGVQAKAVQATTGSFQTLRASVAYANALTTSATVPAYSFDGRTDTGMYSPSVGTVSMTAGGTEVFRANASLTTMANVVFGGISQLGSVAETVQQMLGSTGNVTHDFSKTSIWAHIGIASNFTPNFANVPTVENKAFTATLLLNQGATPYMANAVQINGGTQTVRWQGNVAPAASANKVDCVSFTMVRVNYAWTVLGQNTAFG